MTGMARSLSSVSSVFAGVEIAAAVLVSSRSPALRDRDAVAIERVLMAE